MQVTETQSDGLLREYKVVIAANDINEKLESRLAEIGQQVRVPGFRPGKVPLPILKQRFGPSVMGEVLERAVNDSSNQAINERGLRPAIQPKIEITSFDEGKDLEYTIALELLPDISIMDFGGIELERLSVEVDPKEVESAMERLASNLKETKPLEKARAAKQGDVLVIDFKGAVNGEELPGMSGEDHHLELGSNRFVAGFEEQLVGVKLGDEKEIKVTFPEEYVNDKLAGQEAVFEVKVKDILEAVLPELNDDFAKRLGEESLEVLEGKVREQIGQEYNQLARTQLKRQLLDKLAEGHDFPVPQGMAEAEFEAIWQQVKQDIEQGRLDDEDKDKSEEELQSEYREIAERRVRLGLLLSEVGRINGIEVTQDELNRALVAEAQRYPSKEREVFEFYQKNPEALANLRAPIFEDKVVDFITALAKVSDRSLSVEDLQKEMEAEDEAEEKAQETKKKSGAKKTAAKKTAAKKAPAEKAAAKKAAPKGEKAEDKA